MNTSMVSTCILPLRFRLAEHTLYIHPLSLAVKSFDLCAVLAGPAEGCLHETTLPPGSDGMLLRSLPVTSPPPLFERRGGRIAYVAQHYLRHYIDLTMGFAAYQAAFSAKTRSTLNRKVKSFAKATGGSLDWRACRTPDELDAFYSLAREVSVKTYQERNLGAGLPTGEAFLAEMRARAGRDAVRAFLLLAQGAPVAYLYCPVDNGVLRYEYLGYDPGWAERSPGTVLQWLALESLFAEGRFRLFDFTEGDGAHKRLFATGSAICADVYVLRDTLRLRTLVYAHRACNSAGTRIARLLECYGLKGKVKRLLRRGRG